MCGFFSLVEVFQVYGFIKCTSFLYDEAVLCNLNIDWKCLNQFSLIR